MLVYDYRIYHAVKSDTKGQVLCNFLLDSKLEIGKVVIELGIVGSYLWDS